MRRRLFRIVIQVGAFPLLPQMLWLFTFLLGVTPIPIRKVVGLYDEEYEEVLRRGEA